MNVPIALAALQLQAAEPSRVREIPYNYTSFSDREIVIRLLGMPALIVAPADGTLKAVHVENSQPVEFDQPLFTIG